MNTKSIEVGDPVAYYLGTGGWREKIHYCKAVKKTKRGAVTLECGRRFRAGGGEVESSVEARPVGVLCNHEACKQHDKERRSGNIAVGMALAAVRRRRETLPYLSWGPLELRMFKQLRRAMEEDMFTYGSED